MSSGFGESERMRRYDYICKVCNILFERSKNIEDNTETDVCPQCGGVCQQKYYPAPVHYGVGGFTKYVNNSLPEKRKNDS